MSDILLDRIKAHRSAPDVYDAPTFNDMADRIEELEGRLAKAEVIVRIIASDKWEERLGEAVDLSCEYLAELMGDEDDD